MNRLESIQNISRELEQLLDQEISSANRDAVIEQASQLIEQRGQLMASLTPPFSEEETAMGQALIPLNSKIERLMNQLFAELKQEMKQLKKQKRSNRQYQNPYKDVAVMDGSFVDSKQ